MLLALTLGLTSLSQAATYVVDLAGDTNSPRDASCTAQPRDCLLREAIYHANKNPGPDMIKFAIDSPGVRKVGIIPQLHPETEGLILRDDGTTIDGYSQPGASPNTLSSGNNAIILIQIVARGASDNKFNDARPEYQGLRIEGANCTVRGLAIVQGATGIYIHGNHASGNKIIGNYLGVNASGIANPNGFGVFIDGAPGNTIGGTNVGERNIISGNHYNGVEIADAPGIGATPTENRVIGNYIGTTADGTTALPNGTGINGTSPNDGCGVFIDNGPGNTIGGLNAGEGNLISGNTRYGVLVSGGKARGNKVRGNSIGTNALRTAALSNAVGIFINGAPGNTIGGTIQGARNTISGNSDIGVLIMGTTTGNSVRGNSIYANGALGIDLNRDSVTTNDLGDGDTGANTLQNFPVLTSAATGSGNTVVTGGLDSKANIIFVLDLYTTPRADSSGYGEGQTYLGSTNVVTDATGHVDFTVTFFGAAPPGAVISATATDSGGNTSEFCRALTVVAEPTGAAALVVTTTQDQVFTDGLISLREALNTANSHPGPDTITFALSSNDVQTIILASELPPLSDSSTTIDGYSQSGASANTLATGSNAVLKIQLKGTGASNFAGLTISGANCTVKGLSLTNTRFGAHLFGSAATGNTVAGNFIGVLANGTTSLANQYGLLITNAPNNTIGGTSAGARNIISGSTNSGIGIQGDTARGNTITGNYLGTNATGTAALANQDGIYLNNVSGTIIGGTSAAERNLLSGNSNAGIVINGSAASANTLSGNFIGINAQGNAPLANRYGVILQSAVSNTIGGTDTGAGNTICGNIGAGVFIVGSNALGNRARGNSIYANGALGIDLGNDGVSTNDVGDGDIGPNNFQNFPVLSAASSSGSTTTITGTMSSSANTQFTLDFYANPNADPSGYGQGQIYLGSTTVTTNASGNAVFSFSPPSSDVSDGMTVSATATDRDGNTSEFSQSVTATTSGPDTGGPTAGPYDDFVDGRQNVIQKILASTLLANDYRALGRKTNGSLQLVSFKTPRNFEGTLKFAVIRAYPTLLTYTDKSTLIYTPRATWSGETQFEYTVLDKTTGKTYSAQVFLTIGHPSSSKSSIQSNLSPSGGAS